MAIIQGDSGLFELCVYAVFTEENLHTNIFLKRWIFVWHDCIQLRYRRTDDQKDE